MVYVKIIQGAVDIIDTCKPVPTNFLLHHRPNHRHPCAGRRVRRHGSHLHPAGNEGCDCEAE